METWKVNVHLIGKCFGKRANIRCRDGKGSGPAIVPGFGGKKYTTTSCLLPIRTGNTVQSVWEIYLCPRPWSNMYHGFVHQNHSVAGTIAEKNSENSPSLKAIRIFPAWFFPKSFNEKMDPVYQISNMKWSPWVLCWNMPNGCMPLLKNRQRTILHFSNAKGFYFTQNGKWFRDQIHFIRTTEQVARSLKKDRPLFEFRSRCKLNIRGTTSPSSTD